MFFTLQFSQAHRNCHNSVCVTQWVKIINVIILVLFIEVLVLCLFSFKIIYFAYFVHDIMFFVLFIVFA